MRCPKHPLTGEFQQMQYPQALGTPRILWPPCPPHPVYNPWMMPPQYPTVGSMPPYSQLLPQVPGSGEGPLLFKALVEAVSKEIKNDEKNLKAAASDGCKKAASADLSVQDQKALIDALKRQKDRELTMQQVFEELGQKYGHPERGGCYSLRLADMFLLTVTTVWQTWFFANYEKLNHNLIPNPNVGGVSTGETGSNASSSQVSSWTRSASNNLPLRSPNTAATNERTRSRSEESEWEDLTSDDQGSTHDNSESSAPRDAPQPHISTAADNNIAIAAAARPARTRRTPAKVTDTDLRAMAQYRFEKGDNEGIRRYSSTRWREFAQRPENRKRSLAAWTCVPRVRSHADAISQYVREFQLLAEGADSKAELLSSLGGAGEQRLAIDIDAVSSQKGMETADQDNGVRDFKENEASRRSVDIDLTVETED